MFCRMERAQASVKCGRPPALPLLFLPCAGQLLAFRHEQLLPVLFPSVWGVDLGAGVPGHLVILYLGF